MKKWVREQKNGASVGETEKNLNSHEQFYVSLSAHELKNQNKINNQDFNSVGNVVH